MAPQEQTASPHILMACRNPGPYRSYLEGMGCRVRCIYSGDDILHTMRHGQFHCLVLDHALHGSAVQSILDRLETVSYSGPVLVVADPGQGKKAPETLRQLREGAFVLLHPVNIQQMYQTIMALTANAQTLTAGDGATLPRDIAGHAHATETPASIAQTPSFGGFVGTSQVMLTLYEKIQNAARSQAAIFITGESGTGKDICAQAAHAYSTRGAERFVALNCAAIPRDLMESELFGHARGAFTGAIADREGAASRANGGTLFLDEIGEMDMNMQTKLLRFLQDGTYQRIGDGRQEHADARIICATNRDPVAEIKAGRFREDLFYRLHVIPLSMPPLRERGDDVTDIAQTLLLRYAREEKRRFRGFTAEAEEVLRHYGWPGNIRELQNIIRNAVVMHDGPAMTPRMLGLPAVHMAAPAPPLRLGSLDGSLTPPGQEPVPAATQVRPLHDIEREAIESAIRACAGNIPRAAGLLQVSPSTLYRKRATWTETRHDSPATALPNTLP